MVSHRGASNEQEIQRYDRYTAFSLGIYQPSKMCSRLENTREVKDEPECSCKWDIRELSFQFAVLGEPA